MTNWEAIHAIIESPTAFPAYNLSGLAVYYYSLYQQTGEATYNQQAKHLFNQQLAEIEAQLTSADFNPKHTNFCALAWLDKQCKPLWHYDTNLFARLDRCLLEEANRLIRTTASPNWGPLLHIMRYFLERLPDAAVAHYLHEVVAMAYGITRQSLAQTQAGGTIQLGLANGLVGELLVLIDIYNTGIKPAIILDIVRNGITALLHTKREADFLAGRYSIFPDSVDHRWQAPVYSNNLSWGHGVDLGVSLVLYKAQQLLGDDAELAKIAELVGLNTLLRTEPKTTGLSSSQFCQGTAGVAYLYHQLFLLSHNPAYQQGYQFWLGQTQNWLGQELPTEFYRGREQRSLCGVPGVSIALLALVDEPASAAPRRNLAAVDMVCLSKASAL